MIRIHLPILAGLALAVAALACSYTPPGKPAPQATIASESKDLTSPLTHTPATETSTPTATPTATPSPTPTPTPRPAVHLAQADRAMFNGDYRTARQEYQAVLSMPASSDETSAAQLGAAKAQLLAGEGSAPEALESFVADMTGDTHIAEVWFLLGQARMNTGDYAGAVEAYRQYQKLRGDLIAPYVNQRIGDALRANQQPQAAADAYRAALAMPSNITLDLREKLAGALLDANETPGAIAQYDAILAVAQSASYRWRIQTLAIQALNNAGQTRQAHQRGLAITDDYAALAASQLSCPYYSSYAYDALVALVGDNVPVDEFKRGLIDYCARQYDPALAAFTRSIQAGNRVAESRYWAGLAFRAQDDTANALRQFNLVIQNFPSSSVWGPAWMEKAKTYAIAQELGSAADTYRELATKYATRPEAPEALWRAALIAHNSGDDEAALSAWQTLSHAYPASEWNTPALLWQGKLAQVTGQAITATLFFSRAAAVDPTGYYGIRAAELAQGEAAPLRSISATLTFDEPAQRAAAEVWLAARLNMTDTTVLRGLRSDLAADPTLQRGLELNKLGLQTEAASEFDAVRRAHPSDAVALYQLAILLRDSRLYRPSLSAADSLLRTVGVQVTDAPPFLARLVYPAYYADLIAPEAQARALDPLLIFALIRQESLFESYSFSTAAAHGLMQIIPSTGQEIATALQWTDYAQSDLYKPFINVKFGVYYLARQRDGFEGDLYAALAAYNGGPGNAAHWKAASGSDPDLFYETISLWETRLYVRRVSEYYFIYQRLYAIP